jgi:phosphate transport system substrate-binding protein
VGLGIAVVVAAAAVAVPLTVVDRSVAGTPVAGAEPSEPGAGPSPAGPPPDPECGGEGALAASGSSLAGNAADEVAARLMSACPDLVVDYEPVGSGAGLEQFTNGETGMAVVDRPLTETEYGAVSARCAAEEFPFVAHPVTVRIHLAGVDELTLDAPTLTKIFSGATTTWDDGAIAALNPDVTLPARPIVVVGRSDETLATATLQQYLAEAGGWTGGTDTKFTGRAARSVQGDRDMLTMVETTDGAIGYTAAAEADGPRSRIVLLEGVAPDPESVATTITAALPEEGLTLDPADVYSAEPASGAYPLIIVSYAVTCAGDATARDFLLTALTMESNGPVFPSGEWADRLATALQ